MSKFVSAETLLSFYSAHGFTPGKELKVNEDVTLDAKSVVTHDLKDHGFIPLIRSGIIPEQYLWEGVMIAPSIEGEFLAGYVTYVSLAPAPHYVEVTEEMAMQTLALTAFTAYKQLIRDFGAPESIPDEPPDELLEIALAIILFLQNNPKGFSKNTMWRDQLDARVEEVLALVK